MTWLEHHRKSEELFGNAEIEDRFGEPGLARNLYREAAQSEERALADLAADKPQTFGITAVSAVSCYLMAHDYEHAEQLAYEFLAGDRLPDFARHDMKDVLRAIWEKQAESTLQATD